jgi:hypothetical protein
MVVCKVKVLGKYKWDDLFEHPIKIFQLISLITYL